MDRGTVSSLHVFPRDETDTTNLQVQKQLETFILEFRLDNVFVYRDQLRENALLQKFYCDINIGDLIMYNEELAHRLVTEPAEVIPLVCAVNETHPIALQSNTCTQVV